MNSVGLTDNLAIDTGINRWDARQLPSRDRLAGYVDRVADSLFASSLTPVANSEFNATIAEVRFGKARAVRFSSTPHLVTRLRREVAKTSEDTIVVGIHISGGVRVTVKGADLLRGKGDMVSLLSSTEFCLETSPAHDFEMLSLLFDGAAVDKLIGSDKRRPVKLLGQQPAASSLRACIELFGRRFAREAPPEELYALFSACEALVATVFIEDRDFMEAASRSRGAIKGGLLMAINDYIERNLHDLRLSPSRVASAFNISTRYLHKLFADAGTTFSLHVLDCRLRGVERTLTSASSDHDAVGAVAKRWGFSNRATFNRTFKQRFHMSPSQFAARATAKR